MTEQEQAEALAAWLAQPAGTAPPDGLDPEVVESVYALQPDRAPVPSLTAEDILAGPVGIVPTPPEVPLVPAGHTGVSEAPSRLPAANRLAGLGVLLATAAALLLVLVPQRGEPPAEAPGAAAIEAMDAVAEAELAEPLAAEAPPAPPPAVAAAPVAQSKTLNDAVAVAELDADRDAAGVQEPAAVPAEANDAVADAMDEFDDAVADAMEELDEAVAMDMEEGMAFGGEGTIPELANAPEAEAEAEMTGGILGSAEVAKRSRPSAAATRAPVMEEPAAAYEDAAPVSSKPSTLSGVGPTTDWQASVDANSLARIQEALQIAATEAQRGRPERAAQVLTPWIAPPLAAGHHCAAQAASYLLQAGQGSQAVETARSGIQLGVGSGPSSVWLWTVYGDALAARGDVAGAEAAWSQAVALQVSGG